MKNSPKITSQKISLFILPFLSMAIHSGCHTEAKPPGVTEITLAKTTTAEPVLPVIADAVSILKRAEVPILCYHQVRDWKPSDSKMARDYIVPIEKFREQMKSLADSGYHAILPDQLYDYLAYGKELPAKPVMITFDDTRLDQYGVALPELNKHGFKGVFFIMTVSLGKPGYMSKEQVKQLADEGNTIGSHTYDHKNTKTYTEKDWEEQVAKPSRQLQAITGKPVDYFAYPFGLWNKDAITGLKKYGFKSVFQLSVKRDENDPLYTIRRIIVTGDWSGATMQRVMKNSFH